MNKNSKHLPMRKLAAIRKARGMTQGELAYSIGAVLNTIYYYESGVRAPSIKTLRKLAAALHCDISDLIEDEPLSEPVRPAFGGTR